MIEVTLKKFGFSEKEIAVYLALLKLGSASVRAVGAAANLNRTTTHDILHQLQDQGLVSFVDKEKSRYFAAESPEHLLVALQVKKNHIEQTQIDVQNILPELKLLYEKSESKPRVKYFEGDTGVRLILQDVLDSMQRTERKRYYVYSSSTIRDTLLKVFPEYNDERLRKNVKVQSISIGPGGTLHGLDERKWLSQDKSAPTYTLLYADKVAIISLQNNNDPIGVVLEDKNSYQTQVMIFKSLWDKL